MCKRPHLDPKALAALEAYGVEMTKVLLMNWTEVIKIDGVEIRRRDVQDWLNWKARKDARVAIITMWAAIAAALLAIPSFLALWR